MNRFMPYLGSMITLAVVVGFGIFFAPAPVAKAPATPAGEASSTLAAVPENPVPSPASPSNSGETAVAATSSVDAPSVTQKAKRIPVAPTAASDQAVSNVAPAASITSGSLDTATSLLQNALVNIICYAPPESGVHSITGSGIIVGSKGMILTNAHVGQYFLFANRDVSCTIRSGSPAAEHYHAQLAYISPSWLLANSKVITESAPSGTGEYDFALLAITSGLRAESLPSSFPSIPLANAASYPGTPVVIASYGAQTLNTRQIQSALFPTIVRGKVMDIFTFATNSIDVLALGGSAAAQEGSSGGGVADASGALIGTLTTSTLEGDVSTRSLNAITASYIRAQYASETGSSIDLLVGQDPVTAAKNFAYRIPALESIVAAQLP